MSVLVADTTKPNLSFFVLTPLHQSLRQSASVADLRKAIANNFHANERHVCLAGVSPVKGEAEAEAGMLVFEDDLPVLEALRVLQQKNFAGFGASFFGPEHLRLYQEQAMNRLPLSDQGEVRVESTGEDGSLCGNGSVGRRSAEEEVGVEGGVYGSAKADASSNGVVEGEYLHEDTLGLHARAAASIPTCGRG